MTVIAVGDDVLGWIFLGVAVTAFVGVLVTLWLQHRVRREQRTYLRRERELRRRWEGGTPK